MSVVYHSLLLKIGLFLIDVNDDIFDESMH